MLSATELYSLEEYSRVRPQFKADVLSHKKNRQVQVGENVTITFEDKKTIQYQIQEMLRIERTFEAEGIQEELDTYTPLIPNGTNLTATMFIEFGDPEVRKQKLQELVGIENNVFVEIEGYIPFRAEANKDLPRSTATKTSAVHFLEINFALDAIVKFKTGSKVFVVIDHPNYKSRVELSRNVIESLANDFAPVA